MATPSIMTGSSFNLWIMSVVLVFSIEQSKLENDLIYIEANKDSF